MVGQGYIHVRLAPPGWARPSDLRAFAAYQAPDVGVGALASGMLARMGVHGEVGMFGSGDLADWWGGM